MMKSKDHTQLICDISELSGLFTGSTSLDTFLQHIVEMIAEHMHSDVCSIYLYYADTKELVLKATKGLNLDLIRNVRLKLGEGLTGLAVKELRPICERNVSSNPNFRYFTGLGEEKYESFLAVPIIRGTTIIGAIVIQNTLKNYFKEDDVTALRAISSQLANTIEMTRLILSLEEKQTIAEEPVPDKDLSFIKVKIGSPGFAFAEGVVLSDDVVERSKSSKKYSLKDFQRAVKTTEKQLEDLQNQIEEKLSDVASLIFTAQILMLKDQAFIDSIAGLIQNGTHAPEAIQTVVQSYVRRFEDLPDQYLQERSHDVKDIGKRLVKNLIMRDQEIVDLKGRIVIAQELFPSDALKLSSQDIKGIILLTGGVTSHLSILARSLQIPLVIAGEQGLLSIRPKTKIILDAEQGNLYIDPSKEVIDSLKGREDAKKAVKRLKKNVTSTTQTKDGTKVTLLANINLLGDLKNALDFKAEGIGLYRTEFPFIVRNNFPSEEEQFVIYKKLVDGMPKREITFRTLDIG